MVQTLNKMVHLKYTILEIWCCHKHITQLPPSTTRLCTPPTAHAEADCPPWGGVDKKIET